MLTNVKLPKQPHNSFWYQCEFLMYFAVNKMALNNRPTEDIQEAIGKLL